MSLSVWTELWREDVDLRISNVLRQQLVRNARDWDVITREGCLVTV